MGKEQAFKTDKQKQKNKKQNKTKTKGLSPSDIEEHLSAPSDVRQFDFNSTFGITTTTDGSCETTSLELQPVVVC
jgi:hypothetical protein